LDFEVTPWFKAVLALILCLSVGLKFAIFAGQPKSSASVERELEKFFIQNGYAVTMSGEGEDPFFLTAKAGDCSMRVYLASPKGWHRYLIPQLKSRAERSFFVFDGAIYEDQPVWKTWFSYMQWLTARNFGMRPSIEPVLGINQSPSCNETSIPWDKIARVRG
jgi:hypothetical protein